MKYTLKEVREVSVPKGIFDFLFYRRLSPYLSYFFAYLYISPNTVTFISLILCVVGSFLISKGYFTSMIIGVLILQISLITDCSDGEVARITNRSSKFGFWFDAWSDHIKYMIIYFSVYQALQQQNHKHALPLFITVLILHNLSLTSILLKEKVFEARKANLDGIITNIARIFCINPQYVSFTEDVLYFSLLLFVFTQQLVFFFYFLILVSTALILLTYWSVTKNKPAQ